MKKITLTVDERVVLHLMEFIPNEEDFEAPEGSTQSGIAKCVGIERKHVPRAVKKLMSDNIVESRVSHVRGGKQRKRVYFLTYEGKALARRLWETLAKKPVTLRDENGSDTDTTFSELCFTHQVGKSPLEILLELQDGNVFSPHKVQKKLEKRKEAAPFRGVDGATEVYKKALKKAWEDSILTKEESALLKELRDGLGISEAEHRAFQDEILGNKIDIEKGPNKAEIFRKVIEVALRDGSVTGDEQDILDELEKALGLDQRTATKIKMEMKLLEGEGLMTTERRQNNFREIYGSVIKESLRDGRISRDEQNIIILLKKLLDIEEKEHLNIYQQVSGKT